MDLASADVEMSTITEENQNHKTASVDTKLPVDLPALRDLFGNDPEDEKMLFDLFFTTSNEALENLKQAIDNDDNEQWRKAAHKIKGSAANMRAENLASICAEAEKNYEYSDKKDSYLKNIKKEIQNIELYFESIEK